MQERRNSRALEIELRLSCINPPCFYWYIISLIFPINTLSRVTHKHVSNYVTIGSANCLTPIWCQVNTRINAGFWLIRPGIRTHYYETSFEIHNFQKNPSEIVICKTTAISFRSESVNLREFHTGRGWVYHRRTMSDECCACGRICWCFIQPTSGMCSLTWLCSVPLRVNLVV